MNLDVLLLTAYWSWRCNPSQVKLQANVFILSTLNKQAVCKVYESSVEGWDSHGLRVFICPECELKNPIPVSTSLTLSSCYDLRCSFDLNMFWWVSEWNGMRLCVYVMGSGGEGGGWPFDVVMQNFFYLSWSVWDRAGCPKTQLEILWMCADSIRGGVRHRGVKDTGKK